jgi:hypothetical protein
MAARNIAPRAPFPEGMRRLLLLVLLLPLTSPVAAPAATGLPAGPLAYEESGPVLVDGGAIWLQLGPGGEAVMGGRPGGTLRRLLRSGAEALSSRSGVATFTAGRNVWTGTVADGVRQVYTARDGCNPVVAESDGDLLAVGVSCRESGFAIVVVRPGRPDRVFGSTRTVPHVAGRYVAWSEGEEGDTAVLYDAEADREVARVGGPEGPLYPVDLQADGKLLLHVPGRGTAWVSPSDPALHSVRGVGPGTVRSFVGDRILTMEYGSRMRVVELDGSHRTLARVRGISEINNAHYDGTRVALARATCNGNRILIRRASALTLREPSLCPLRVTRRLVLGFGNDRPVITGRVRCIAETLRRCDDLVVRTLDGRKLSDFSTDSDYDGDYGVSLNDGGVRRIAREGRMRVRLEMRRDFGGPLLQRPATTTLRVGPRALGRLRRCVRARRYPSQFDCPA